MGLIDRTNHSDQYSMTLLSSEGPITSICRISIYVDHTINAIS